MFGQLHRFVLKQSQFKRYWVEIKLKNEPIRSKIIALGYIHQIHAFIKLQSIFALKLILVCDANPNPISQPYDEHYKWLEIVKVTLFSVVCKVSFHSVQFLHFIFVEPYFITTSKVFLVIGDWLIRIKSKM